ncbi:MAG: chromosomal replication initiator DnaA [Roseinatronobacter sp.]
MTRKHRQMPIPISLPADFARARFIVGPCNAQALHLIEASDWPAGKLVLTGPEGSGKTHLLRIWAKARGAVLLDGASLIGASLTDADLTRAASRGAVALDRAGLVASETGAETALFHLHNMLAEAGGQLLLADRQPVRDWGLALPDLLSRLQASAHVALSLPDDALLEGVLRKLFEDRQVQVTPPVIPYLLSRMERSLGAASRIVARLDAESLARKSPITRQLAADVMEMTFARD